MKADLQVIVAPDSGTGGLEGITGTLTIRMEGGKHYYDLAYTLPAQLKAVDPSSFVGRLVIARQISPSGAAPTTTGMIGRRSSRQIPPPV